MLTTAPKTTRNQPAAPQISVTEKIPRSATPQTTAAPVFELTEETIEPRPVGQIVTEISQPQLFAAHDDTTVSRGKLGTTDITDNVAISSDGDDGD